MNINRDRASRYGVTPQMIDETLNDALGQRQVAEYYTQTATYNVVLEIAARIAGGPKLSTASTFSSPLTGQTMPLSTLVTIDNMKAGSSRSRTRASFRRSRSSSTLSRACRSDRQ